MAATDFVVLIGACASTLAAVFAAMLAWRKLRKEIREEAEAECERRIEQAWHEAELLGADVSKRWVRRIG